MKKIYSLLCIVFLAISTTIIAQPTIGINTFFTSTTTALNANTACTVTKTNTVNGWLFSVSSTSNCGLNWTNSTGGDGRIQYLIGFGTLTQATFGSDDGSEFALVDLVWGVSTSSWTSKAMTFVGYKDGSPVSGATLNATTPSGTGISNTLTVTFTSNPAFKDVDDIRLAPNSATCNSICFLETITIGTATPSCVSPTLSLTGKTDVKCNGGTTGSATVSASGGPAFTYTWSPSGGNAAIATGLSAGIYTCVVTNSCGSTASKTVNIAEPSAVVASTAVTMPLCNGANGSGTITLSGGTPPYTYTWSSGPTSSVEPTLLAGTYTVRGTDANGCTTTKSVTITQPSAVATSTGYTNVFCFGGVGSASVLASGGTSPYTYTWSTASTGSFITGVPAGSYTVKAIDANNCSSATRTIIISQPPALVTSTAITNVLCFGNSTGAATVTASGGTGGYSYSWSTLQTTSVVTGLNAGVKTVTVTDGNGCTKTNTVTIIQPLSALNTATAITNVLCFGNSTGSATVTASGGAGGYSYSWSSSQTTSVVTGLNAGVKTVTVTDANNCTATNTITISQPVSALNTATAITNVLCFGNSTGAATVTASGGAGGYSYSWSSSQTTSVVTGLNAGVKTVTVTDANNCTATNTITISQPISALSTATAITNVLCFGNSTGAATVTASGGAGGYSYSWSSSQTTSVVTGLNAGVKTVTVTDANNCVATNTVTLSQPISALSTATAITNVLCFGNSTGAATVTASGGAGGYSYSWSSAQTTSVITGLNIGVKTVTVTDANNCTSVNSISITQPAVLNGNATASSILCNGGVSTVTVSATGGTPTYSGVGTFTMLAGSNTFTITDANSCSATASVSVSQPAAIVSSQTVNICSGKTYSIGVNTYSTSGIYTDVLTSSVNGCDSTVTTNLVVGSAINISTSLTGLVITANNTLATSYQWIDCNNSNLPISGQTNQTYTATANGNYAVIITEGACSDTSACVNIIGSGIVNMDNNNSVHIYPNPSTGLVSISSSEIIKTIIVTDLLGKQILFATVDSSSTQLDLSSEKNGVYVIKLIGNTQTVKRIILSK